MANNIRKKDIGKKVTADLVSRLNSFVKRNPDLDLKEFGLEVGYKDSCAKNCIRSILDYNPASPKDGKIKFIQKKFWAKINELISKEDKPKELRQPQLNFKDEEVMDKLVSAKKDAGLLGKVISFIWSQDASDAEKKLLTNKLTKEDKVTDGL